jgi:hypothetical protein
MKHLHFSYILKSSLPKLSDEQAKKMTDSIMKKVEKKPKQST